MKIIQQPDDKYLMKLNDIKFQPIFILGLHRSGTSILYKMLTETGCFNPVTAYHLIRYNEILYNYEKNREKDAKNNLTNLFKKQGQNDRKIDRLELTSDFAEEYGFLLGQYSLQMYLTPKNIQIFSNLAKKIQYISNNDKPLLLKNPYDFQNFLYIKKVFPNAKFIFIHRHPFKILSSTIKALRILLDSQNPYTTQLFKLYEKLFDYRLLLYAIRLLFFTFSPIGMIILTNNAAKYTNYYLKNINKLQKEDYISLTYENLCDNPQQIMEDILRTLKIKANRKIYFTTYIKPRKTQLDLSVIQMQCFIFEQMKSYFREFNYNLKAQ